MLWGVVVISGTWSVLRVLLRSSVWSVVEMSEIGLRMIIKLSFSLLDYTFAANLAYKKNT